MASFDDKVEALKRLCERRRARQALPDSADAQLTSESSEPALPSPAKAVPAGDGCELPDRRDAVIAGPESLDSLTTLGDHTDNVANALAQLEAVAAAAKAAETEDATDEADALFCLGHCFEHGIHDCEEDKVKALEYYQLAAEKGNIVAQWRIGEIYEYGRGVEQSDEQAVHWYRRAAVSGHCQAQSSLALLLEDGRGVAAADDAEAFHWHLAAAEQDQALSQYCVACCFGEGRGTARDEAAAHRWLELSAAAGFPPAQEALRDRRRFEREAEVALPEEDTDKNSSLVALAARVASELKNLDDGEAEMLLDELLADLHSPLAEDDLLDWPQGQRAGTCSAEVQHLVGSPTAQSAPAA